MLAHETSAVETSAPDPWSLPSPSLPRRTLAVGTTIALPGIKRRLTARELAYLHAALTKRLGRSHDDSRRWSVMPWQCESGCAVMWWDADDGLSLAKTSAPSRIGSIETDLAFGHPVCIHAPPAYTPGRYCLRLTTRSIVVVSSVMSRGENAGRRVYRTAATTQSLENALVTLAGKLGVRLPGKPHADVVAYDTRPSSIYIKGKPRRLLGWEGSVDIIANAPARWLLECASRGLGLGARGAYGCGAVTVEGLE